MLLHLETKGRDAKAALPEACAVTGQCSAAAWRAEAAPAGLQQLSATCSWLRPKQTSRDSSASAAQWVQQDACILFDLTQQQQHNTTLLVSVTWKQLTAWVQWTTYISMTDTLLLEWKLTKLEKSWPHWNWWNFTCSYWWDQDFTCLVCKSFVWAGGKVLDEMCAPALTAKD